MTPQPSPDLGNLSAAQTERRESVIKTLKDFTFTRLVDAGGIESWRCQEPGSSHLAHDITITKFGMSVMGDIDGLLFNADASYGLAFLAGKDVKGRIYEKLEPQCKEMQLDRDGFLDYVYDVLAAEFDDRLDKEFEILPAPVFQLMDKIAELSARPGRQVDQLGRLKLLGEAIIQARLFAAVVGTISRFKDEASSVLDDALAVTDLEGAIDFFHARDERWFDTADMGDRFVEPCNSLMFRLTLVNESARRIVAIKDQERNMEAAVEESLSPPRDKNRG